MDIGANFQPRAACALRALCNGELPTERIERLPDGYALAAYAAATRAGDFVGYAKVFRSPVASYWDACLPLGKFCGQQAHPSAADALQDALDVAFMALVNDGAVSSGWAPLAGSAAKAGNPWVRDR